MSQLSVTTIKSLTASTPPVIQDSAGTQIGTFCRAWVNFNGTGTVAIRAAFNVSSVTDVGVGTYIINMATALPDANYCLSVNGYQTASGANFIGFAYGDIYTVSAVKINTVGGTFALTDMLSVSAAIFR